MIKLSANGAELTLDVSGYQFPDAPPGDWDDNWLQIKGTVKSERGEWSFHDPCMTATELSTMASWLMHVATLHESSQMSFLEPCLELRRDEADPLGAIVVVLSHEASPPWVTGDARYGDAFQLRLATSVSDLAIAAKQALALATRYPDRSIPDAS